MIWVWVSGRVTNPEFLEQVMPVCSKEDLLIVVIIFHLISRYLSIMRNLIYDEFMKLSMNSQLRAIKVG